ncbi:dienelactone hydrolase family protein [Marimonas lutisalis]|uniref:dienelactone hydrolase family protein n=1 Tax=Marimonas lutisalis TaxID=2545756 RepID=UPI0010F9B411|nr:dienelactone hydrolase family protein [Marimonas lutisalis]
MFKFAAITALTTMIAGAGQAGQDVTYKVGGETFEGYFAEAENASATVVILPTWNGISDYEKDRAQMLMKQGYNALAADVHGVDALPRSMEEKQAAYEAFFRDQERLQALLREIVEVASERGDGDVFVMGYSMGGGATMELARSGLGNALGVDGYAVFSGRVSDPQGRMMPDGTAPIFVAHGEKDARVPVSGLTNFEDDLDLAGITYDIHIYPGAGHLFSAMGFPNYNAAADADSWAAYLEFLGGRPDS